MCRHPPPRLFDNARLYNTEKSAILSSLKRRAKIVGTALNKLEGVSCQVISHSRTH